MRSRFGVAAGSPAGRRRVGPVVIAGRQSSARVLRRQTATGVITGVVTSESGPEAGVWVIAETDDLNTKFRKIVVTNDAGRFLLPELPRANYRVWVRGYGLVDSKPCHGEGRAGSQADRHDGQDAAGGGEDLPRQLLALADGDAQGERLPRDRRRGKRHPPVDADARRVHVHDEGVPPLSPGRQRVDARTSGRRVHLHDRRLEAARHDGPARRRNGGLDAASRAARSRRCSRAGATGSRRAKCRRRRRGRAASSATSC